MHTDSCRQAAAMVTASSPARLTSSRRRYLSSRHILLSSTQLLWQGKQGPRTGSQCSLRKRCAISDDSNSLRSDHEHSKY